MRQNLYAASAILSAVAAVALHCAGNHDAELWAALACLWSFTSFAEGGGYLP